MSIDITRPVRAKAFQFVTALPQQANANFFTNNPTIDAVDFQITKFNGSTWSSYANLATAPVPIQGGKLVDVNLSGGVGGETDAVKFAIIASDNAGGIYQDKAWDFTPIGKVAQGPGSGANTITLAADEVADICYWQYKILEIIGNTGEGQAAVITDCQGLEITVDRNWVVQPDSTSVYRIIGSVGVPNTNLSTNLTQIMGQALTETSAGNIAANVSTFFDNSDVLTVNGIDDIGGGAAIDYVQVRDSIWKDATIANYQGNAGSMAQGVLGGVTLTDPNPDEFYLNESSFIRVEFHLQRQGVGAAITSGQITPGTYEVHKRADGEGTWTEVVPSAALTADDGMVFANITFNDANFDIGDRVRIRINGISVDLGWGAISIVPSTSDGWSFIKRIAGRSVNVATGGLPANIVDASVLATDAVNEIRDAITGYAGSMKLDDAGRSYVGGFWDHQFQVNLGDEHLITDNFQTFYRNSDQPSGAKVSDVGSGAGGDPASAVADAVLTEVIADHSGVAGSLAQLIAELARQSVTPGNIADDSIFARLVSKSATASWASYNNTTDSLEAIADAVPGGGPSVDAIADGVLTELIADHRAVAGSLADFMSQTFNGVEITPMLPAGLILSDGAIRLGVHLHQKGTGAFIAGSAVTTPGTVSIDRKDRADNSWQNVVNAAALQVTDDGKVFVDEEFNAAAGYQAGDAIRLRFFDTAVTLDTEVTPLFSAAAEGGYTVLTNIVSEAADVWAASDNSHSANTMGAVLTGAIAQVIPFGPTIVNLNDGPNRIGINLVPISGDEITAAEISPGTFNLSRKATGDSTFTAITTGGACQESDGMIYVDEVFNAAGTFAAGDEILVQFFGGAVTRNGQTQEVSPDGGNGIEVAFSISRDDASVWDAPDSAHTAAGTMGKHLQDINRAPTVHVHPMIPHCNISTVTFRFALAFLKDDDSTSFAAGDFDVPGTYELYRLPAGEAAAVLEDSGSLTATRSMVYFDYGGFTADDWEPGDTGLVIFKGTTIDDGTWQYDELLPLAPEGYRAHFVLNSAALLDITDNAANRTLIGESVHDALPANHQVPGSFAELGYRVRGPVLWNLVMPSAFDLSDGQVEISVGLSKLGGTGPVLLTEITTPGTYEIWRKATGSDTWSQEDLGVMVAAEGRVYFTQVFNAANNYALGDQLEIRLAGTVVTPAEGAAQTIFPTTTDSWYTVLSSVGQLAGGGGGGGPTSDVNLVSVGGTSVSDPSDLKADTTALALQTSVDTVESTLAAIQGGGFNGSTDSLEAIRDRGDAAWTTGVGGGGGANIIQHDVAEMYTWRLKPDANGKLKARWKVALREGDNKYIAFDFGSVLRKDTYLASVVAILEEGSSGLTIDDAAATTGVLKHQCKFLCQANNAGEWVVGVEVTTDTGETIEGDGVIKVVAD